MESICIVDMGRKEQRSLKYEFKLINENLM